MQKFSVFDYQNFRKCLAAWWAHKQASRAVYTNRWLARKLDTKDPNVLRCYTRTSGRKPASLKPTRMEDFINIMELNPMDADYFRAMVQADQGITSYEIQSARSKMLSILAVVTPNLDPALAAIFSHPLKSAVRELARNPSFELDAQWVMERLRPGLSLEEIQQTLDSLVETKLIIHTKTGWRAAQDSVETPAELRDMIGKLYHHSADELAKEYFEQEPELENSVVVGFSATIPKDRLQSLRALIYEKLNEVAKEVDSWGVSEEVYQINLRSFPLTVRVESEPEEDQEQQ